MHFMLAKIHATSIASNIVHRILPTSRKNIITYTGVIIAALMMSIPSQFSSLETISPESELEFAQLHAQYPRLSFYRYITIKIACTTRSRKYKVPVPYMCALANNESEMNDYAVSKTGDYGWHQVNAYYQYRGKNPTDLFNFELNTALAVSYYAQCLDKAVDTYGWREVSQSFRFYNAGMSSDKDSYKNWDYVINIMDDISESNRYKESSNNRELALNY